MPTINGTLDAQFNRESITFTPNVGGEYGGRWEGPKAKIQEKMAVLIANGYAVQYECDSSPIATLSFNTTTNNTGGGPTSPNVDYTDNFQLLRNTVQKELLMSDHPLIAGITGTNLDELRDLIANPNKITINSSTHFCDQITGTKSFSGGSPTTSAAKAQYMLDLFLSGVRSVEVKQPILRVTRVTNPLYDAPFNTDRVDRVLSTSTMISDSGVPSNFAVPLLDLATRIAERTAINGSSYAVRNDFVGLKFGWLKDAITSETVGRTKNQYTVEYKFGLYDVETYGAVL